MNSRYILSPRAAEDLVEIWTYINDNAGREIADRVSSTIREKFVFPSANPAVGHRRDNQTDKNVRFFPVYSYLIVYRAETEPLQIASILYGRRDVQNLLRERL